MIVKKIICSRRISEATHHRKSHKNTNLLIQNLRNKEKHDNNHNEKQLNTWKKSILAVTMRNKTTSKTMNKKKINIRQMKSKTKTTQNSTMTKMILSNQKNKMNMIE